MLRFVFVFVLVFVGYLNTPPTPPPSPFVKSSLSSLGFVFVFVSTVFVSEIPSIQYSSYTTISLCQTNHPHLYVYLYLNLYLDLVCRLFAGMCELHRCPLTGVMIDNHVQSIRPCSEQPLLDNVFVFVWICVFVFKFLSVFAFRFVFVFVSKFAV